MEKSYLAFDLGASSGRGIIGKVKNGKLELTEIHRFKNFPFEKDGHFFWDFDHLVGEIKTGIRKAYQADPSIRSIAIDTWGVDYVFFKDGNVLRTPYNYRDPRTNGIPEEVHATIISESGLYAHCGIQDMSINTVYQLYAHKKMFPQDFDGGKILFMPDALAYMLTGDFTTEYTIASTGSMLNPNTRTWDLPLLEKLGIPSSVLPEIVMPCTKSLPLKREICEELGVPAIQVVKVGSHDTASAVASTPVVTDQKWAYISSGTWALLGAELNQPNLSPEAADAHFTNEGGIAGTIRFLTNIMGTWLLQETKRIWNEAGNKISFQEMEDLASAVNGNPFRIDPNCPDFLIPGDMPARIREYCRRTGQGEIASDAELLRCIYDSLADCFKEKLFLLEKTLQTKFDVLHILGGGIRDKLLMQSTANAVGIPVVTGPLEATATGNILAQMMADGALETLAEARKLVSGSVGGQTFTPIR